MEGETGTAHSVRAWWRGLPERTRDWIGAGSVILGVVAAITAVGFLEARGGLPVVGWSLAALAALAMLVWVGWQAVIGGLFAWPFVLICAVIGGFAGGGGGALAGAVVGGLIGRLVLRFAEGD